MLHTKSNRSTAVFAAVLIVSASFCLTYNMMTANDTSLTAVFSDRSPHITDADSYGAVSAIAASNLLNLNAVTVSASPMETAEGAELLPPIILPPEG